MIKNKFFLRFTLLVIGLAIASLIAYVQIKNEQKGPLIMASNFAGPINLIDQNNQKFTQEDLKGSYSLIYFGFTYCPAICPTELQRMARVLNALDDKEDNIKPIFITVDPERDDVKTMHQYVKQFHPKIVGLTGTQTQINQAKKSYKIYAAKVQDETMSDYTMDHSSFIYFIDPNNNLLRIFKTDDSVEDMIKVINAALP
jgi:protein SCO1/2